MYVLFRLFTYGTMLLNEYVVDHPREGTHLWYMNTCFPVYERDGNYYKNSLSLQSHYDTTWSSQCNPMTVIVWCDTRNVSIQILLSRYCTICSGLAGYPVCVASRRRDDKNKITISLPIDTYGSWAKVDGVKNILKHRCGKKQQRRKRYSHIISILHIWGLRLSLRSAEFENLPGSRIRSTWSPRPHREPAHIESSDDRLLNAMDIRCKASLHHPKQVWNWNKKQGQPWSISTWSKQWPQWIQRSLSATAIRKKTMSALSPVNSVRIIKVSLSQLFKQKFADVSCVGLGICTVVR